MRLLRTVTGFRAGVVIADLDPADAEDGSGIIPLLAGTGTSVVVLTASNDVAWWGRCLALGADKVVSKATPLAEILATIRRIGQGLPVLSAEERDRFVGHWRRHTDTTAELRRRLALLTPREAYVLGMLMEGKQVADIAREAFVAPSTVRTQVKSVLAKLQVGSQLTAVGLARKAGWQAPCVPAAPQRIPSQRGPDVPAGDLARVTSVRPRLVSRAASRSALGTPRPPAAGT